MLTRVLELDSNDAFAWHTLGQMHEEQGRHAEALASYGSGCQCTGDSSLVPHTAHHCILCTCPIDQATQACMDTTHAASLYKPL